MSGFIQTIAGGVSALIVIFLGFYIVGALGEATGQNPTAFLIGLAFLGVGVIAGVLVTILRGP